MIELDNYHEAERIAPGTWRISEAGFVNCYLLEGAERALLVDAACGAGDLRACAEQLTGLPVTLAVTHRHPDHVGGAWRFGGYLVSRDDLRPVYSFLCLPAISRKMATVGSGDKGAVTRIRGARTLPMKPGQAFDLGGRTIHVEAVPGHTAGSVIFVDEQNELLVTGDDVNPDLWMHLPGCTSLETWRAGARVVEGYLERGFSAWYGHGDGVQTLDQVRTTMRLVDELLEKRASGEVTARKGVYPHEGAPVVVRYRSR